LKRSHQTFRSDLRVRTQDIFTSRTAGEQLEDVLDADPGSANAWLATEDSGARNDPVEHRKNSISSTRRCAEASSRSDAGKTMLTMTTLAGARRDQGRQPALRRSILGRAM